MAQEGRLKASWGLLSPTSSRGCSRVRQARGLGGLRSDPDPPARGEETWRAGSWWARGLGPRGRPSRPGGRAGIRSPTRACCPLGRVPRSRAGRGGGGGGSGSTARRSNCRGRPGLTPRVCRGAAPPSAVGLGRLLHDPPEDCRSDGGSSSGGGSSSAGEPGGAESSSSPRAPEREIPEPGDAEGPGGHLAATQRPGARSKIKVRCRLCPRRHLAPRPGVGLPEPAPLPAAPPAHRPPAHPGAERTAPSAPLLHLLLGLGGAAPRLLSPAGWPAARAAEPWRPPPEPAWPLLLPRSPGPGFLPPAAPVLCAGPEESPGRRGSRVRGGGTRLSGIPFPAAPFPALGAVSFTHFLAFWRQWRQLGTRWTPPPPRNSCPH